MGDDQAEILERYSGQIPGSLWALGLPLLTMGIYIFAFLIWSGAAYSIGLFLQPIFISGVAPRALEMIFCPIS